MSTPPTALRVRAAFAKAKAEHRAANIAYLTFGFPTMEASLEIVLAAADAGADIIELGVPFSDPSADGPSIQRAMEQAIEGGAGLPGAIALVAQLRQRGCQVPVVLFGYYNPIVVFGVEKFAQACAAASIDAVLTVDLPVNELAELAVPLAAQGVGVVPLMAPTSTPPRFMKAASFAPPFIYYISMTGVTGGGAAVLDHDACALAVSQIRTATGVPIAMGFGIRNAAAAQQVAKYADGVIVGSWFVDEIANAQRTGAVAALMVGAAVASVTKALAKRD
jgi:tryptophan synthase alpha chain